MPESPLIIPSMKVGTLLDTYPELEDKLISLAPAFKKLKNPLLRRTIAKVVTLQQAAATGEISLEKLINNLRSELGQPELIMNTVLTEESKEKPVWLNENSRIIQLDVTEIIESGGVPLPQILSAADELEKGEILELVSPIYPAPIIDKLKAKGFKNWSESEKEPFHIFFFKE